MNQTLSTLLIIGLFATEGQAVEAVQADAAAQDYSRLPVQQAVLHSPTWQALQRFPALYPLSAAMKHVEGCATVELITIFPTHNSRQQVLAGLCIGKASHACLQARA